MAKYTIELPDDLNSEEQKHTGGFIKMNSLEQARADLQATLTGKNQPVEEEPQSEAEARAMLRRTQKLLASQSQPGAKKAAKKSK
jgi:hypothetical protein